ncbi:MAG: hypothetical protein KBD01_00175 [Acidobacteria bacterium]|nr:hypothetical protein [Acidobacteriota bacterium]
MNRWIAALGLIAVLLLLLPGIATAADEKHQGVRGVRAGFSQERGSLRLELLLANGDTIVRLYEPDEVPRIVEILKLAAADRASLFADLEGKKLVRLYVEFGAPPPFRTDENR